MKIYLEPFELDVATQVGTKRYLMNLEKQDKGYYANEHMEHDLTASIYSCVAELAVAKQLNQYWGAHWWLPEKHNYYKGMADVGTNVEVRRLREPNNAVPVRSKDVMQGCVVYGVYVPSLKSPKDDIMEVTIVGYINADEGWQQGERPSYDRYDQTRLVRQELLNQVI